jgi:DNA-binding NarL/FixJ family response regulator
MASVAEQVNPADALSPRELHVFAEIGRGKTIKQIAAKLRRSPKTVESQRESIKRKLGLRNTYQLIRKAVLWVEGVTPSDMQQG